MDPMKRTVRSTTDDLESTIGRSRIFNKSIMKSMNTIGSSIRTSTINPAGPQSELGPPSPLNFDIFMPWACQQFAPLLLVTVKNERQRDYVPNSDRNKARKKAKELINIDMDIISAISILPVFDTAGSANVAIQAIYNADNQLVHIKFLKNKDVPRRVLQILRLIVNYYRYLEAITMDRGIDRYTIYEISKLLHLSNITELCFDNTFIQEANYYILLDNPNQLKHLSLSKCNLYDACIEEIAKRLEYPQPASKILSILNLSGNMITDVGVKALARCLRSNRQLSYLNLAGNRVTDEGASALFNILLEFPLTDDEMIASKKRFWTYLRNKTEFISNLVSNYKLMATLPDQKVKKNPPERKKTITISVKKRTSLADQESYYEKAREAAKAVYGEFTESYVIDVVKQYGILYSNGNNTLAYVNLAYNSLTELTLKKIIKVFQHQKSIKRKPRGLVNINIEGNPFDLGCKELLLAIDMLIDAELAIDQRASFIRKQKSIKSIK